METVIFVGAMQFQSFLLNTTPRIYLQSLDELTEKRFNYGFLCSGSHERHSVFSFQELNQTGLSGLFLTSFVQ